MPTSVRSTRQSALGRPAATTHESIASAAMGLFLERGYDATTMDDIATAAGVSIRTLWRYFSSKGEILWLNFLPRTHEFEATLATVAADTPVAAGAFDAWRVFSSTHPDMRALDKQRLLLVITAPAASTGRWAKYAEWGEVFVRYVAVRRGGSHRDLENRALGMMIWAAMWEAAEAWARSDEEDPDPFYRRALAMFAE